MLKRIPKSDISIRPFKAYKEWSFDQASFSVSNVLEINERVAIYSASFNAADTTYVTMSYSSSDYPNGNIYKYYPKSIYGQLKAQFYNGNEDNPFLRFGNKQNTYEISEGGKDRFLSGSAKVISIPQIYVGEGIKKGSVTLLDDGAGKTYVDDTYGNIIDSGGDTITIVSVDIQGNQIIFNDLLNLGYTASFQNPGFDIQSGNFDLTYGGETYQMNIISFDIESGVMVVDNIPFLEGAAGVSKIGNIFYTQGLIVITRSVNDLLLSNWDLSFKSTQTIYEHEYLLIVNEDEFNVSQNPSAIVEVGKETAFITGSDGKIYKTITNAGIKYIRKKSTLENGNILDYTYSGSISSSITNTWVSGGFEHYDLSGSVDSTGSFLAPFITTIGLYDDNCDLVAVAKLPQPIKSEPDIPVNFIIRFDT